MFKKANLKMLRSVLVYAAVFPVCAGMSVPVYGRAAAPVPSPKPAFLSDDVGLHLFAGEPASSVIKSEAADAYPAREAKQVIPRKKPAFFYQGPLRKSDIERYKNIFAYQSAGKMAMADFEIEHLQDYRLMGHVLQQRYLHPTAYTSTFEELHSWMVQYHDHPGADKIHALLGRKKPSGFSGHVPKPVDAEFSYAAHRWDARERAKEHVSSKKRSAQDRRAIAQLKSRIRKLVDKTQPSNALKTLQRSKVAQKLDKIEYDSLMADIAAGYLYASRDDKAFNVAREAAERSGSHVPLAGWVAGIVAWKHGYYDQAAEFFEMTGSSEYATPWTASAGAFWAARAHSRIANTRAVETWLDKAAAYPRTFYGLLATQALGRSFSFDWEMPSFNAQKQQIIADSPAGKRAMALVDIGQTHLAEQELERIGLPKDQVYETLLAYASHAGLPRIAMRLGQALSLQHGRYYDAALYPVGGWLRDSDYQVDPALVHAIMRQESKFNPHAESPSGAKGLMQLMPRTASYVAGRSDLRSKQGQKKLMDPQYNLQIAQDYMADLLRSPHVNGDLVSLLIAYNAGPGNLKKWQSQLEGVGNDLLFIELIPSRETRAYVERVLANYWIYRLREGRPTPTLEALAAGNPAKYAWDGADFTVAGRVEEPESRSFDQVAYEKLSHMARIVYNN